MKKLFTMAALLAATTSAFAACDREDIIPETKLPDESRAFIKTHFDGVAVASVVREIDGFEKDYSVYLKNGFEINFRRSGAWDEVEGHREPLPATIIELLPAGIAEFTAANYPDRPIVAVNRERWGYEIELGRAGGGDDSGSGDGHGHGDGEIELDFTEAGDFFRYDD
jgi:hypothetical protein